MTINDKIRTFNKYYKDCKWEIIEASETYRTSGMQETFEKSRFAETKYEKIPYAAFLEPAIKITSDIFLSQSDSLTSKLAFINENKGKMLAANSGIAGIMYAVNQWTHYGKQVFDFDPDFTDQLMLDSNELDFEDPIPISVINSIPGQGFFVSLPTIKVLGREFDGFFVNKGFYYRHMKMFDQDIDDSVDRPDISESISFVPVLFKDGDIKFSTYISHPINIPKENTIQGILDSIKHPELGYSEQRIKSMDKNTGAVLKVFWEFLLYLCTENANIKNIAAYNVSPDRNQNDNSKGISNIRGKHTPDIKVVGEDVGIRIRKLKASDYSGNKYALSDSNSTKKEKAPHIRRGHYHSYWVGKHETPERRLILKWIDFTLIHPEKMEEANVALTKIEADKKEDIEEEYEC